MSWSNTTAELIRISAMRWVLPCAARSLPRAWACWLADGLSWLLVVLPEPGQAAYWRLRDVFGRSRLSTLRLVRRRLARPLRDCVVHRRILAGREDPLGWRINERHRERVADVVDSGESYILATAHFQREALMALALPSITPGTLVQAGLAAPPGGGSLGALVRDARARGVHRALVDARTRLQLSTLCDAYVTVGNRGTEIVRVGGDNVSAKLLYDRLRRPGTVVNIHIDAVWTKRHTGSFARPFAGLASRDFSLGAAQLAKLTGRPIVGCVYWTAPDGSVVVDWTTKIARVGDERDAMSRLIDAIETAVGERPDEYTLDIGDDRRWDADAGCWVDAAPAADVAGARRADV